MCLGRERGRKMIIRKWIFKNNYLGGEPQSVEAQYGTIGYFDGMDTKLQKNETIPDNDGNNTYLTGIHKDGAKDNEFWNENSDKIFVFVSRIRLKKTLKGISKIIGETEQYINENYEPNVIGIGYKTLDSSDMIICLRSKAYIEGFEAIQGIIENFRCEDGNSEKEINNVDKAYTVCSIEQEVLNELAKGKRCYENDEKVECILKCILKQRDRKDEFKRKLADTLNLTVRKRNQATNCDTIEEFGVLGSDDLVYYLNGIELGKLLTLYADDGVLTHSSYGGTFYNIETVLLKRNE